jgi:four helix bundle protein
VDIYKLCEKDKIKNDFGIKDQLRRSAASISNNISEGYEYNNNKQFVRYLAIAKGSAGELRNQIHILSNIGYITEQESKKMLTKTIEVSKQISGFISYLKNHEEKKKKQKV